MKTLRKIFIILIVLFNYSIVNPGPASAQQGFVDFQVFYDELSPFGQWVDYSNYGYVWIPDLGLGFTPYLSDGYWVLTDYGWTWISNYPWGWAPFHYGRWDFDDMYGWFWVPDYEWGPSWVIWRRAAGYYGWTPMRPGISINLAFANEYRDIDRWNFVRDRDFGRNEIGRYSVNRRDNDMLIKNSTVINNTYVDNRRNVTYITGPGRDEVQSVTGRRITSVTVRDNDQPGEILNNNQLQIYRPRIERITDGRQRPAPSKITNLSDVRPVRERSASSQINSAARINDNTGREQQVRHREQTEQQREEQQAQSREQIRRQRQEQQAQSQERSERRREEAVRPSGNNERIRQENKVSEPAKSNRKEQGNRSNSRRR